MMTEICAAAAVALSPLPTVSAADRWDEASRYDTLIPFIQLFPYPATAEQGEVILSPEAARRFANRSSFFRGTSAGFDLLLLDDADEGTRSGADLVSELRRLSGLTWEKVAELVDVRAKTVYNWVAGHTVAEKNLHRLAEIVAVLRFIDRGYGEANRDLLMKTSVGGRTLFSLLAASEFDLVKESAGVGHGRPEPTSPLSSEALRFTGPDHFGTALSHSESDESSDILPLSTPGKRATKARRKVR